MLRKFQPAVNCVFFTPAKINFRLNIVAKEANHHLLKMDIMPITLQDQITLSATKKEDWQIDNTAERLVIQNFFAALSENLGIKFKLKFSIKKNIPFQAGLGGSSGNIGGLANALKFLLADNKINHKIEKVALSFGKDVAFFLQPKASLASGYGDKLAPLADFRIYHTIIFKPAFNIATKDAYLTCQVNKAYQWVNLKNKPLDSFLPALNDFWQSSLPFFKQLNELRSVLLKFKAVRSVLLTGSGSCLVLLFDDALARDVFFYETSSGLNFGKFYIADTTAEYNYRFITLPKL